MTAQKTRVALLFGGRSSEHQISCATASGVLSAIDRERFEVIPVGITESGAFILANDDAAQFALNPDDMPRVLDNGTRVHWPENSDDRELRVTDTEGETHSLGDIDTVFPLLHGPYGEDGTIQGMLELFSIPFVGSGVLASAMSMDKHFAKLIFQSAGLTVTPWRTVTRSEVQQDKKAVVRAIDDLGLPVFVKPSRAGSSVGVSKVSSLDQLDAALEEAFKSDSRVLIESTVVGREIELAVLEGRKQSPTRVSVAGEIVVTGRDFYDFEAKYLSVPGVDLVCPAKLTESELAALQEHAARAFDALGCEGLSRVDFFLTPDGPVINEINTMPGFTPISMFPTCWQLSGVSYPELITELIELSLQKS
ncbi:D-alanine--D-alanine ligase family protein [Lysinibacter sp. HNR]|uniref:D-alanine--D-alanine ligase family protein n=1 Tax=Lysinibacter sp. HNR TaxID=3031408 RepID=UPI002434EF30|nr:D-alanine--D-alanine ligase family protein [Lysinibacter sp. HNR]WGD38392.1 D-alanine--D-alanine ligase [Lysinibacter sp. HNR]